MSFPIDAIKIDFTEGTSYGHDQANVLAHATAYWSVTSCSVDVDMDEVPLFQVGNNKAVGIVSLVRDIVSAEQANKTTSMVAMSE